MLFALAGEGVLRTYGVLRTKRRLYLILAAFCNPAIKVCASEIPTPCE